MRYIAIAAVLLSLPLLISWLRANGKNRLWAYFGLGLFPFTLNAWNLDASLISWAGWPGYAKGMTLTIEDTLALAVIMTHPRPRGAPPLTGFVIAYLLAVTLSIAMSNVMMGSAFYSFQVLRMLVVFVAVAKIAADRQALLWLAMGLASGITYQAGITIWQRANGMFQASGTMGHQNLLGLMTHFVTLPLFAMLLAGVRNRVLLLGVASGVIVMALGASRGAIGFGTGGMVVLMALSLMRGATAHKRKFVMAGFVVLLAVSPFTYEALQKRFTQIEHGGGGDERAAFERAAKAIWADHPMGIGANQYVVVSNSEGYSDRAGVIWNYGSRSANVHNTYLLAAAETGWAGLLTLIALLAAAIISGARFVLQNKRDPRGDVVLGCTIAIAVTVTHNLYEWVFVTYQAQYVFAISLGIIAAMVRARATERRSRRRESGQEPAVTASPAAGPVPVNAAARPGEP